MTGVDDQALGILQTALRNGLHPVPTELRGTDSQLLELQQLVHEYASAIDARDEPRFASLFEADAVIHVLDRTDPVPQFSFVGRDKIATLPQRLSRYDHTFHFVGNHRFRCFAEVAVGEIYSTAHHITTMVEGQVDRTVLVRYRDVYRRTDAWRFAERRISRESVHIALVSPT